MLFLVDNLACIYAYTQVAVGPFISLASSCWMGINDDLTTQAQVRAFDSPEQKQVEQFKMGVIKENQRSCCTKCGSVL